MEVEIEELALPNHGRIDSEKVFNEVNTRINDAEILEEIEEKFDFSNDHYFIESLKSDYHESHRKGSILLDDFFENGMEHLEDETIKTIVTETIVLKYGRPSLLVQNGLYEEPISKVWTKRLKTDTGNNKRILNNIPSVGRIELKHHSYDWIGTGWLLKGSNYIITNRHVAESFAKNNGMNFVFKQNLQGRTIKVSIDFKEEFGIDHEVEFRIEKVLYISPEDEPDIAILKVKSFNLEDQFLPNGLVISSTPAINQSLVYTIGYPARDSRIADADLMERIFKGTYNVKRLAPGRIINTQPEENEYHHDCSTLGGNSGSPVIDLLSGEVVGLHHAGNYRKFNWAVQCEYLNYVIQHKL